MKRFWTALGLVSALSGPVLAAESAPAIAENVEPARAKTVDQIEQYYDRQLVKAIGEFIKRSKADDPEVEKAYMTLFNKTIEHDWYAQAQSEAGEYLKSHPEGQAKPLAQIIQTMALADSGKFEQAEDTFKELLRGIDATNQQFGVQFGQGLAQRALTAGKVEVARGVYQALLKKFPDDAQLKEQIKSDMQKIELIGKAAPSIKAKDTEGKEIALADYKGKLTLVDFWATWCGPCVAELPNVKEVYDKYHGKGFDILGISLDEDAQTVKKFVESKDIKWRQIVNGRDEQDITRPYGVMAIPSTFLVGPDGKIVQVDLRGEGLGKAVEALLSSGSTK